jgi:hypothetical protein
MKLSLTFVESGPSGAETESHTCKISEILNPGQAIAWATKEINKYVTENMEQTTLEQHKGSKKAPWKGRGARKKIERQDDGRPIEEMDEMGKEDEGE